MTTVTVKTKRGAVYEYTAYPINSTGWNNVAGNYIFAAQNGNSWTVLYIGQTEDFAARFPQHDKIQPAIRKGATHILARVNKDQRARMAEEAELIAEFQPPLNQQLK